MPYSDPDREGGYLWARLDAARGGAVPAPDERRCPKCRFPLSRCVTCGRVWAPCGEAQCHGCELSETSTRP